MRGQHPGYNWTNEFWGVWCKTLHLSLISFFHDIMDCWNNFEFWLCYLWHHDMLEAVEPRDYCPKFSFHSELLKMPPFWHHLTARLWKGGTGSVMLPFSKVRAVVNSTLINNRTRLPSLEITGLLARSRSHGRHQVHSEGQAFTLVCFFFNSYLYFVLLLPLSKLAFRG